MTISQEDELDQILRERGLIDNTLATSAANLHSRLVRAAELVGTVVRDRCKRAMGGDLEPEEEFAKPRVEAQVDAESTGGAGGVTGEMEYRVLLDPETEPHRGFKGRKDRRVRKHGRRVHGRRVADGAHADTQVLLNSLIAEIQRLGYRWEDRRKQP